MGGGLGSLVESKTLGKDLTDGDVLIDAATGGNVLEGALEGCLTGALGAACGILIANPVVAITIATLGSAAIDVTTQVASQWGTPTLYCRCIIV